MKTKNFLLPAFAIAIFAIPTMALDFDNYQKEIANIISEVSMDIKPLTIDEVRQRIYNPEKITNDELNDIEKFAYFMKDKISDIEQYNIMQSCIINKHDDILEALIVGGFDPSVDIEIDFITLPARAVEYNDIHSFVLTFDVNEKERALKVLNNLQEMDKLNGNTLLVDRYINFISQVSDAIEITVPVIKSNLNNK